MDTSTRSQCHRSPIAVVIDAAGTRWINQGGLRDALTRPVALTVSVHDQPLPPALAKFYQRFAVVPMIAEDKTLMAVAAAVMSAAFHYDSVILVTDRATEFRTIYPVLDQLGVQLTVATFDMTTAEAIDRSVGRIVLPDSAEHIPNHNRALAA